MTVPRQSLMGSTYMVTRRVSERRFFLRPDALIAQLFGYLFAIAAEKFGV